MAVEAKQLEMNEKVNEFMKLKNIRIREKIFLFPF